MTRMNASAVTFQSFSAKVHRVNYNNLFQSTEEEDGTVRMHRDKKKNVTGIADFSGKDERAVQFAGHTVKMFHPKANSVEVYDMSKYTHSMDQFLLLGFGISGTELQKAYTVSMAGDETLGGVKTTRLQLVPKSAEVLKLFTKIELWIPAGQANPVQEKFTQKSGDYSLARYTDLVINPNLPASAFELKLPAGVKIIQAGK